MLEIKIIQNSDPEALQVPMTSDRCHGAERDCGVSLRILRTGTQGIMLEGFAVILCRAEGKILSPYRKQNLQL